MQSSQQQPVLAAVPPEDPLSAGLEALQAALPAAAGRPAGAPLPRPPPLLRPLRAQPQALQQRWINGCNVPFCLLLVSHMDFCVTAYVAVTCFFI